MDRIPSFTVDHTKLLPGIYVSRKDRTPSGDILTTFDIRLMKPNEDFMLPEASHTIEHIGATFLRNEKDWKDRVVYFGPMGCLTGFYLILMGDYGSVSIVELIHRMFVEIRDWDGPIPGSSDKECGNAHYHNLRWAKHYAEEYLKILNNITADNLCYPN